LNTGSWDRYGGIKTGLSPFGYSCNPESFNQQLMASVVKPLISSYNLGMLNFLPVIKPV